MYIWIAISGQTNPQNVQDVHFSGQTTSAKKNPFEFCVFDIPNAFWGHADIQSPHPLHISLSIITLGIICSPLIIPNAFGIY